MPIELSQKTILSIACGVSLLSGGGLGSLAGAARAEEKLALQDKKLAVIETEINHIKLEVAKVSEENKETRNQIHDLDKKVDIILDRLPEKKGR